MEIKESLNIRKGFESKYSGGDAMARPLKQGLDYFPLDVDIFEDYKIEFIRARFDEKGELIVIKLLCNIFKNGYYLDFDEDWATIFAPRVGRNTSHSLVKDVVGELVKRDFFDKSIFNSFGVLTSRAIQRRYIAATAGRKEVEIQEKYWLLDMPFDTKKTKFLIIPHINGVNPPINQVNPPTNSQSKGKESKVKENKKNKKPTSKKFDVIEFLKPMDFSADFKNALWKFSKHRQDLRKPLSELALETILKQFDDWGYTEYERIQCLNNSIASGWQGVFELSKPKERKNNAETIIDRIKRLRGSEGSD